jgi:hypothetical protein
MQGVLYLCPLLTSSSFLYYLSSACLGACSMLSVFTCTACLYILLSCLGVFVVRRCVYTYSTFAFVSNVSFYLQARRRLVALPAYLPIYIRRALYHNRSRKVGSAAFGDIRRCRVPESPDNKGRSSMPKKWGRPIASLRNCKMQSGLGSMIRASHSPSPQPKLSETKCKVEDDDASLPAEANGSPPAKEIAIESWRG